MSLHVKSRFSKWLKIADEGENGCPPLFHWRNRQPREKRMKIDCFIVKNVKSAIVNYYRSGNIRPMERSRPCKSAFWNVTSWFLGEGCIFGVRSYQSIMQTLIIDFGWRFLFCDSVSGFRLNSIQNFSHENFELNFIENRLRYRKI